MQKKEVLWVVHLPPTESDGPSSFPIPHKCVRSTSQEQMPNHSKERKPTKTGEKKALQRVL